MQADRDVRCSMTYYSRSSSAYDFTLFEDPDMYESGDKAEDIASDGAAEHQSGTNENKNRHGSRADRRNTAKKSGRGGALRITLAVIFGIAFAFIVVSIIHGQVQLTELNQEIANAKTQLAEQQSVYTQLQMKVDSSISTAVVEEYARDNLNMNKAANSQKEFINLSEGDKAEVTMTSEKNIFEAIAEAFASLWS